MMALTPEDWKARIDREFPYGVHVFPVTDENDPDWMGEVGDVTTDPQLGILLAVWPTPAKDFHFVLDSATEEHGGLSVSAASGKKFFLRPLGVQYKGGLFENVPVSFAPKA